jgi:hypothetical protein
VAPRISEIVHGATSRVCWSLLAMIRAVAAAPAIVTRSVIAAAAVMVEAVMLTTNMVGWIVAALVGLRDPRGRQSSHGSDRQHDP